MCVGFEKQAYIRTPGLSHNSREPVAPVFLFSAVKSCELCVFIHSGSLREFIQRVISVLKYLDKASDI